MSPAQQRRRSDSQLQQLHSAVDALLAARTAAAAAASSRAGEGGQAAPGGGGAGAELAEAPEDFLDPILMTLMQARMLHICQQAASECWLDACCLCLSIPLHRAATKF